MSALQLLGSTALLALLAGALLASAYARWRARVRGRAHNTRGQRGEQAAEQLLARHGYVAVARQVRSSYCVQVETQPVEVCLQADFVVERGGRRLVAEVKTGRHAPRFQHAETRRQLLEYQLGFDVEAVLLVDVEAGSLREVCFPWPAAQRSRRGPWLALLMVIAASGGYCWFTRPAQIDRSALSPTPSSRPARVILGPPRPSR